MTATNTEFYDRPCAISGLVSYRYRGTYGWIMIGAKDDADAMREASRSTKAKLAKQNMQVWRNGAYHNI